jgi:hypothetical protein
MIEMRAGGRRIGKKKLVLQEYRYPCIAETVCVWCIADL